MGSVTRTTLSFVEPCIPKSAKTLPAGPGWLHEPKLDGWRIQLVKTGERISLFTRNGHDCAHRLPQMTEAFAALPVRSCIIDGELVADEEDRIGNVFSINRAIGDGRHDQISLMAFDLIHFDGKDLRGLPLIDRKNWLDDLVSAAQIPSLSYVAPQADGERLFTMLDELGLEGVVAKRSSSVYRSGRRGEWLKVKCPRWLAANRERWSVFARPTKGV